MPRTAGEVLSHWHVLFEDFRISPQDFYIVLEAAIRKRNLPDVEVRRVLFKEGGIASANREYLRVQRRLVVFDVCCALYGNGQFFSWWLAKTPAKYGLLVIIFALFFFMPVWFLVSFSVLQGCGYTVALAGAFFGFPLILLLIGLGVEKGLIADEEWVLSVPVIGYLYAIIFNPITYFRLDTAYMFRDAVRAAVNEAINQVREEKGLRLLSDEDFSLEGVA